MDMTTLTNLLTRIEAATGPSKELDLLIGQEFGDLPLHWRWSEGSVLSTFDRVIDDVIGYTSSLDAAIALCERVLPGWQYVIAGPWLYAEHHEKAGMKTWDAGVENGDYSYQELIAEDLASGATPALALCAAIVRAKISEESNG